MVTNRPGCGVLPRAVYDEYTGRGESENRNKELKRGLPADRLSDHRFLANFFRPLPSRGRGEPAGAAPACGRPVAPDDRAELDLPAELPTAALGAPDRKRFFNQRRRT